MVIPSTSGSADQQPPPDLPSYLFNNRIVYLGMTLVPAVTELILAELLYLQFENAEKPIFMYINSTGSEKKGEKYGYDTEAFAIYDTMCYCKAPIHTICVGSAFGEAAMLLAAGHPGARAALPSASIMLKQPMSMMRGQASDLDIKRKEVMQTREQHLDILALHTKMSRDQIAKDSSRNFYLDPAQAVEYGIIDKVLTDPMK